MAAQMPERPPPPMARSQASGMVLRERLAEEGEDIIMI
jgi:hypothetical protein